MSNIVQRNIKFNLKETCRACMSLSTQNMKFLFSDSLAKMFTICTNLKVSKNDQLPHSLCESCARKIKLLYKFQIQCKKTESLLQSYFENKKNDDTITKNEPNFHSYAKNTFSNTVKPSTSNNDEAVKKTFIGNTHNESRENKKTYEYSHDLFMKTSNLFCGLCNFCCENTKKLSEHLEVHKKETKIICNLCKYESVDWADLHCHRFSHQEKNDFQFTLCPICNNSFHNMEYLEIHIRSEHLHKTPIVCRICLREFKHIKNLHAHEITHSGLKANVCSTCGKSFLRKRSLILHKRCHANIREYMCHKCGIAFRFHSGLISHNYRLHSNVESVKCNHCNKTFKNKETHREHLLRVMSPLKYKCSKCLKMFRSQRELQLHSKWHSNVKPFECTYCDKSYKTKSHLTNHVRQHTGERPYRCDLCDKTFTILSVLKRHKRIHTGEKPYICKICTKAFIEMSNLKNHIMTHKHVL